MSELVWQKSSFSGDDANRDCVEVAAEQSVGVLLLRESDAPGAVIRATPGALRALVVALNSAQ